MTLTTLRRSANYLAAAHAARKLSGATDCVVRQRAEQLLAERLGKLRGLPQKLGQMLSFTAEPTGDSDSDDGLASLRESAQPLPWEEMAPVLEANWQVPVASRLASVEPVGRAASLGQVHRATTVDGREVAVKIQFPGMRAALQTDLSMLGWLSLPLGGLARGFDLAGYRQVIQADLDRELDYRREAVTQQALADWAARRQSRNPDSVADLVVPRVFPEWSTGEVLVTEWVEGETWDLVRHEWDAASRKALARSLVGLFCEGLFVERRLQADWHPGNVRFRRVDGQAQWVWYDFGCCLEPSRPQVNLLARLIRASQEHGESPWPLFLELGFQESFLAPLAAKLPALCRVLFEPFCVEYPYDVADWRLGERVGDILGPDRWNFRMAGPPEMMFLLRAFHGLLVYLRGLGAPVSWRQACERSWEMARLPEPAGPRDAGVQASPPTRCDFGDLARHLKIRVVEHGETRIELTQRADRVDNLLHLLDDDLQRKIASRGIDLAAVVTDARRRGYAPGPLFSWGEGFKQVAVWLE